MADVSGSGGGDDEPDGEILSYSEQETLLRQHVAFIHESLLNVGDYLKEARIGKALINLLEHAEMLQLWLDAEDGYKASCLLASGRHVFGSSSDMLDVLMMLYGDEQKKKCRRCGSVWPLSMYSKYKTSKDGRNNYCRICERARVKKWSEQGGKNRLTTKKCLRCREEQPTANYWKHKRQKDGLDIYCKCCRKAMAEGKGET